MSYRYSLLLICLFGLMMSSAAQANALSQRHEFVSAHALRYPAAWSAEPTATGLILRADNTTLTVYNGLPSWYRLEELMDEYGSSEFQTHQIRFYTTPDGRNAARAEYRTSDGNEAIDIAVRASDSTFAYFSGVSTGTLGADYETIIAIANSYDMAQLVSQPTTTESRTVQVSASDRLTVPFIAGEYDPQTYVPATCPFYVMPPEVEGETVECGYLIVPEERRNPNSANIQLLVMTLLSPNPYAPDEPIIYLEGGPGGSAVARHENWDDSTLRQEFDIVLIDQRGTGFSRPNLNCPEYQTATIFDNPAQECATRLREDGITLAAYNSFENAADIADLIAVRGYEQANLFGSSYGSRLALTILRDHPQVIRSIVIEGIFPPTVNAQEQQARNAFRAFDALFLSCAADPACNDAYPNLRASFFRTIRDLNQTPLEFYSDYYGQPVTVTGDSLIDTLFSLMYSSEWVRYLPALIYAADQRDGDAYAAVAPPPPAEPPRTAAYDDALRQALIEHSGVESEDALDAYLDGLSDREYDAIEDAILGRIDSFSEGFFNSVTCREEVPFNSLRGFNQETETIPTEISDSLYDSLQFTFNACESWAVPAANARENDYVYSDLPVLLLSGQYDPITPPDWGDVASTTLDNGYHVTFPSLGHGVIDIHTCPTQVALAFFFNPMRPPDTSCTALMTTNFYTP